MAKSGQMKEIRAFRADMIKVDPQGKYLLWIDWGSMSSKDKREIVQRFEEKLKQWMESGAPIFTVQTFGQQLKMFRIDEENNEL